MGNYQGKTQFHSLEEVERIEEGIIKHVGGQTSNMRDGKAK